MAVHDGRVVVCGEVNIIPEVAFLAMTAVRAVLFAAATKLVVRVNAYIIITPLLN